MFARILVPLDGSPGDKPALAYATELAETLHGSLVLIHVDHHAPRTILDHLEGDGDELVVMAECPHSLLRDTLAPSPANTVVAAGRAPVLLVDARSERSETLHGKRVAVALDGSDFARAALPIAAGLARALDTELLLLYTVDLPPLAVGYAPMLQEPPECWPVWQLDATLEGAEASLKRTAERLRLSLPGLEVVTRLVLGDVAEQVDGLKPSIGLVVMATHARSGFSRLLLGSPPDDVFRRDHLPLLLVHPPARDIRCAGAA